MPFTFGPVLIAQSSDDASQLGPAMSLTVISPVINDSNEYIAFRWDGVTIPPGATITSATVTVEISSGISDEPLCHIWCHAHDNAPTFTSTNNDISDRTATTATVAWDVANLGLGVGDRTALPDLSTCVQEVIDRSGWLSGNAIVVIIKHDGGDTNRLLGLHMYDSAPEDSAELTIEYTLPPVLTFFDGWAASEPLVYTFI